MLLFRIPILPHTCLPSNQPGNQPIDPDSDTSLCNICKSVRSFAAHTQANAAMLTATSTTMGTSSVAIVSIHFVALKA